jgi:hypothetical protein
VTRDPLDLKAQPDPQAPLARPAPSFVQLKEIAPGPAP